MKNLLSSLVVVGILLSMLVTPVLAKEVELRPGPTEPIGNKVTAETQLKPGQAVQILWKKQWWFGSVLSVEKDGKVKVHYYGWDPKWDEAVPRNRLLVLPKKPNPLKKPSEIVVKADTKLKPGDPVQVEWKKQWWLGSVVALQDDGKVKVHYFGWPFSWDEVVERSRLRLFSESQKKK